MGASRSPRHPTASSSATRSVSALRRSLPPRGRWRSPPSAIARVRRPRYPSGHRRQLAPAGLHARCEEPVSSRAARRWQPSRLCARSASDGRSCCRDLEELLVSADHRQEGRIAAQGRPLWARQSCCRKKYAESPQVPTPDTQAAARGSGNKTPNPVRRKRLTHRRAPEQVAGVALAYIARTRSSARGRGPRVFRNGPQLPTWNLCGI